ncbi:MAG: adenylate/guanylate cyclase domain-containing protein [Fimbriimonadaceae bacterium]|nr:adenylate/guanylate cyclase domain-containing protein [Alphaproteobacteria bacterium]
MTSSTIPAADATIPDLVTGTNERPIDNKFVDKALEENKREGLVLGVRARWLGLAVIAPLIVYLNQDWDVIYYLVLLAGFALIGWAQLRVGRVGQSRAELVLLFCDIALLTFTLLYPNPFHDERLPLAFQYQFDGFIYFFFLLAGATLAYTWRTIIVMGTWTAAIWMAGFLLIWYYPTAYPEMTEAVRNAFPNRPDLWEFVDPNEPHFEGRLQEVTVFLIVAITLAVGGWRSRQLLLNLAKFERERANLARYFSPNVVDELSNNDASLKQVRTQDIAVLFVDIVGFTAFAEDKDPRDVIETLREFHALMEGEVFKHNGTLDKYLGDGLMATFGTPFPSDTDASNALACIRKMIKNVRNWNLQRENKGELPLRVGFGAHFGQAVLGDIGANRMEFAVIGNTVNVASRLETLTRDLEVPLVASDSFVRKALSETNGSQASALGLIKLPAQSIRGLVAPIDVWTLDTNL